MEGMVNSIIGLVIALLPLYTKIEGVDVSRISKDNLLVVILGLLCFMLSTKRRSLPASLMIGLVYALSILVFNQWNSLSVIVMLQMFYLTAGIVFFACFYERHSDDNMDNILNGMAIGCIIQSLIVMVSAFGFPIYFNFVSIFIKDLDDTNIGSLGIGSLGNSNLLASYVALTAISLFRRKWAYLIPLPIITLLIADSMMGYASLLAGSAFFLNQKFNLIHKAWLYILSSTAMVTVFFTGAGGQDHNRFHTWTEIFKRVDIGHFLVGKGPGWFFAHGVPLSTGEYMAQEHNEFLAAFNIFGVIGLILLIPSLICLATKNDHNKHFAAIVFAAFCNAYGHFNLHQSTTAIIIIVALAACLAERDRHVYGMER